MKNKKIIMISSMLLIIGFFIIGVLAYQNYEAGRLGFLAEEKSEVFVRSHSHQMGAKDAKVFLIEFLDPECESCRQFYPQVKELLKQYEGKVKLVVRYAPFHGNSKFAIKALEAAARQDKYWDALELLFKYQPQWGDHHNPRPELILDYLPTLGLDMAKLKKDMEDPVLDTLINQEIADLRELKVRGTPSFYINGKPLNRFGLEYLKLALEAEISKFY